MDGMFIYVHAKLCVSLLSDLIYECIIYVWTIYCSYSNTQLLITDYNLLTVNESFVFVLIWAGLSVASKTGTE